VRKFAEFAKMVKPRRKRWAWNVARTRETIRAIFWENLKERGE
jgi:hypothetical protein